MFQVTSQKLLLLLFALVDFARIWHFGCEQMTHCRRSFVRISCSLLELRKCSLSEEFTCVTNTILVTEIFCYWYSTIKNSAKNNIFLMKFCSGFRILLWIKCTKFYLYSFRVNIFIAWCLSFLPDTVYTPSPHTRKIYFLIFTNKTFVLAQNGTNVILISHVNSWILQLAAWNYC